MSLQKLHDMFSDQIRVRVPLGPTDWADKHRYLSVASSSEPGPWRTSRTPYIREILDSISPSCTKVRRVIVQKGHQLGYTEGVLMNALGWVISEHPGPSMLVAPSEKAVKKILAQKIDPMIRDSPVVKAKISTWSRATKRNTMIHKDFDGGFIVLAGSTVPSDLAGNSIKYLFLDEVDRFEFDTGGEGSPVELAIGRTSAYNRRKIVMGSTPVQEDLSVINKYFLEGDQRYYYVPCPHCGHMQVFSYDRMEWKPDYSEVWITCEACERKIHEKHKTRMLAHGEWRATAESHPTIRSYHLSSLYSPVGFLSWTDFAMAGDRAAKDEHYEQTFKNLYLGIPSSLTVEKVPSPILLFKREQKELNIPDTPYVTAGVDVQDDRLEIVIVGWVQKRCYVLGHEVIFGEILTDGPWAALQDLLYDGWGGYSIHQMAIDRGHAHLRVFDFYRMVAFDKRVVLVLGIYSEIGKHVHTADYAAIGLDGKDSKVGSRYHRVNTHFLKREIYSRLITTDPEHPNYVHFAPGFDQEFYEQLCSERMTLAERTDSRVTSGLPRYKWIRVRRNEILDCMAYNLSMWYYQNVNRKLKDWPGFISRLQTRDRLISDRIEAEIDT